MAVGALYRITQATATSTTTTPAGGGVLVHADTACRGAESGDNSAAYYVVISATSLQAVSSTMQHESTAMPWRGVCSKQWTL